ncbi:GATA transcription factor 16-like isoform X1 [Salvia splendens]|uniref:GATA transcription factor 16-like isoform X1 n=1 Tax=Salvia splendens TaxID=180675 RepID=UPI001C26D5F6|nr:GATA transcription factor 16-like isoform X1 [Salvia splendens]
MGSVFRCNSQLFQEEGLSTIGAGIEKCCSDCRTTTTPLWRSGPSGPKSLCNACGIRHRKKRAVAKNDVKKGKIGKTRNLIPLGKEVEVAVGRRSAPKRLRRPKEWGEVERAALLLMALSFGAVFA